MAKHNLESMPIVRELMTTEVYAVSPATSLDTVSRLLTTKNITGAPVVDGEGSLVGVISRTDLLDPDARRSGSEGVPMYFKINDGWAETMGDALDTGEGCVADVMTPTTLCIEASATITDAAQRMLDHKVHRLLVLSDDEFVGVLSAIDLVRGFLAMHGPDAGEARKAMPIPEVRVVA